MRPIRVAHIVGELGLGGAEKLTATIAATLSPVRFETSVYCLGTGGYHAERLRSLGTPVHALGLTRTSSPRNLIAAISAIFNLANLLRQKRVDIVHTHLFITGFMGRVAAKLAGVPIITHSLHRIAYGRAEKTIERLLSTMTSAYIVDSQAVGRMLGDRYGSDPRKIHVIYNGIDPLEFDNRLSKAEARNQLGLPLGETLIGIIAHMTRGKGQGIYIEAFRQVVDRHPNTRLLLVGDGPECAGLKEQVGRLQLEEKATFLGYREDLARILAASDILAHPSEWEGFGIVLAEAMYCGIPVITTDAGGGAEVVVHNKTGLLVPPNDIDGFAEATLRLLDNPQLVTDFGKAGRKRVAEHFLQSSMTHQYEELYSQLFAEGSTMPL